MPRTATRPARPAPAARTTERDPHKHPFFTRPYSFFRPFPTLPEQWRSPEAQDQLLHEWLVSMQSIPLFAKNHGLTVDQLFDWLHSEQIVDRRKRLEHMAAQRAESLARLNLPDAIGTLAATMRDPNALPKERRLAASAIVRAVAKADKDERAADPTALRRIGAQTDRAPQHTEDTADPRPESPPRCRDAVSTGHPPDTDQPRTRRAHIPFTPALSSRGRAPSRPPPPRLALPSMVLARLGPARTSRPPRRKRRARRRRR